MHRISAFGEAALPVHLVNPVQCSLKLLLIVSVVALLGFLLEDYLW
jgi:hypothetical protein